MFALARTTNPHPAAAAAGRRQTPSRTPILFRKPLFVHEKKLLNF
jgi:hypothetical protein